MVLISSLAYELFGSKLFKIPTAQAPWFLRWYCCFIALSPGERVTDHPCVFGFLLSLSKFSFVSGPETQGKSLRLCVSILVFVVSSVTWASVFTFLSQLRQRLWQSPAGRPVAGRARRPSPVCAGWTETVGRSRTQPCRPGLPAAPFSLLPFYCCVFNCGKIRGT